MSARGAIPFTKEARMSAESHRARREVLPQGELPAKVRRCSALTERLVVPIQALGNSIADLMWHDLNPAIATNKLGGPICASDFIRLIRRTLRDPIAEHIELVVESILALKESTHAKRLVRFIFAVRDAVTNPPERYRHAVPAVPKAIRAVPLIAPGRAIGHAITDISPIDRAPVGAAKLAGNSWHSLLASFIRQRDGEAAAEEAFRFDALAFAHAVLIELAGLFALSEAACVRPTLAADAGLGLRAQDTLASR